MSDSETRDDDKMSINGDNLERKYTGPPYDHLIINHEFKNNFLFIEKREKRSIPQKSFMKINTIGEVNTEFNKVRHVIWYTVHAEINGNIKKYNFKYGDKASEFVDSLYKLFIEQENLE